MKDNENYVSGNGNSSLRNASSKSGNASNKYGNDTKVDEADIRPSYDTDSLEHVHNDDYNVFTMEKEHLEQLEYVNDTYLVEQGYRNTTPDSSDMNNDGGKADQDDAKEKEHALLASLIENMKREIDERKQMNKCLKAKNTSLGRELERYQDMKCVKYAKF
ncbi:hypothetical protein Tco_1334289 [Tanacetum coccineum]